MPNEDFFLDKLAEELAEKVAAKILERLPKPNIVQPRYFTVAQAAAYIGHSPASFHYLLTKNFLPVIRRERLILIDRLDLERALERLKR